jgi:phenylalanyl-tRNA synthetase alpha chain
MMGNIPYNIKEKIGRNIYMNPDHPICIMKDRIYEIIGFTREKFEGLDPYVSVKSNFEDLLIPKDHPSRSKSDTYYKDESTVLRTHTSAHQTEFISKGHRNFLLTGDVYRRDEIDAFHYPVFHQMEGVTIYEYVMSDEEMKLVIMSELGMLIANLFPNREYRWEDSYFPFTEMSGEIEVDLDGKWVEVLGCGRIRNEILESCGLKNCSGWAFGLGLERLAMILFKVPDIRYFWTQDERFHNQFRKESNAEFKPYSNYPNVSRDVSFYYPPGFDKNDFFHTLNVHAQNLVASTTLVDQFHNPNNDKRSYSFRIFFESLERTLTNEEINRILDSVKKTLVEEFGVEIR